MTKPDIVAEALAQAAAIDAEIKAEMEKFVPLSEEHQRHISRFQKDYAPPLNEKQQRVIKGYALWNAIRHRISIKGS